MKLVSSPSQAGPPPLWETGTATKAAHNPPTLARIVPLVGRRAPYPGPFSTAYAAR